MKKLLIWGTGNTREKFQMKYDKFFSKYYEITAYIDKDKNKQEKGLEGKSVYAPEQIGNLEWDMILLCTISREYQEEMLLYLEAEGIERTRIVTYLNCEGMGLIRDLIMEKYCDSKEPETKEIMDYIKEHEMSVFNMILDRSGERYQVYCDSPEEDPYIWIDDKRMYYPKEFLDINTTPFLYDIYAEQSSNSPHLYIPSWKFVSKNSIIVDAGAREGNFALKYVNESKKIYIFECEKKWCRALSKTFSPYRHKVSIHNSFLGNSNNGNMQTLDRVISESIDFLKMDIEGAEINALKGAEKVLGKSHAFCSICAYHNSDDKIKIENILNSYGYKTSTSSGYMLYGWDDFFYELLDFRRGVVYGQK